MTAAAIPALEREVGYAQELFATLTAEEWASASGCEGWRVQDVAQHMAAVFQQIADASSIDVGDSGRAEPSNEVPVQARKDWTVAQVLDAYAEWAPKGVAALAALQEPPMADMVVPISDLGTHPLNLLGNAIVFDHYCHLRHDLPGIDRAAALPTDAHPFSPQAQGMKSGSAAAIRARPSGNGIPMNTASGAIRAIATSTRAAAGKPPRTESIGGRPTR